MNIPCIRLRGCTEQSIKRKSSMEKIKIGTIPAIVWGEPSEKVYLHVHGKMSNKESAEQFSRMAERKGYQVLSFDLPGHGERISEGEQCDIWTGVRDVNIVCEYVFSRWSSVSLYACSIGAYFCLQSCSERSFEKCLFQSPIIDMEYLIGQMMLWFGITPERLKAEQEIETPVDLMTWAYYTYVKEHPIVKWPFPTHILYAGKDNLQSEREIASFADRFACTVTVSPNSEHSFMNAEDVPIIDNWLNEAI